MGIIVAVLTTLLVAGAPALVEATGLKIKVTSPGSQRPPERLNYGAVGIHRDHDGHRHHDLHRHHDIHHHHVIRRAPVIVVPQPVVVVIPRRCVEPGYWAYDWVPQSYASNVWVPDHYDSNALWVEGRYEPRGASWGYYQPYWVPERWAHC